MSDSSSLWSVFCFFFSLCCIFY